MLKCLPKKTPSIATLMKIAGSLDIQMSQLFGETVGQSAITLVRRKKYQPFPGPNSPNDYELMMVLPQSDRRRLSVVVMSPGPAVTPTSAEHPGEELIYMLEGRAQVCFADRIVNLSQGDCVHFDGHLRHALRSVGRGRAKALVVLGQDLK